MFRELTATVLAIFLLGGASLRADETSVSASVDTSGLDVATIQEFENLDRDRDRVLSAGEFSFGEIGRRAMAAAGEKAVARIFSSIDRDGSGTLDLLELVQSQQNRNARLIDRVDSRIFILTDLNGDGLISYDEYLHREDADSAVFSRIDVNHSSQIGPVEWVLALKADETIRESITEFISADTDDSGSISAAEYAAIADRPPGAPDFEAMDLNGNRELSSREYLKAASTMKPGAEIADVEREQFRAMDRNDDQTISFREFSRYSRVAQRIDNDEMLERLFMSADQDGDRALSISEFADFRLRKMPGRRVGGPRPPRQ